MTSQSPNIEVKPIKLLITIVDQGQGEAVQRLLRQVGNHYHIVLSGMGTAKSDILELFGLRETRKDVLISAIRKDKIAEALDLLREQMHIDQPGHGIAFTVPINSVGGLSTLKILASDDAEEDL